MAVLPVGIGPVTGYQIERSLRFNSADSAYLSRTFGSPTNAKKWTYSLWVKGSPWANAKLLAICTSGSSDAQIYLTGGQLQISSYNGAGTDYTVRTDAVYRDPSSWYHFVFVYDTDNGTSANRAIIYVNGVRQSVTTPNNGMFPSGYSHLFNTNGAVTFIGARPTFFDGYFGGYLTEINFVDGQALTPSSFGQTNASTGVWEPIDYTGTYGNNGFYLNFSNNTSTQSLGWDQKSNITRYATAGTYSYTVPSYSSSLVVEVWGGGGGGGQALLPGTDATNGGQSSFNGTVIANGGNRGVGASSGVGANGTGGTASGGDTNTTGNTGNSTAGASSSTPSPNSGNSAIAGVIGPGGFNGVTGYPVGSGGGGAYWTGGSVPTGGAGGSGGYSKKTYAPGAISGTITVVVGAGGSAGVGGALNGGAGTAGMVRITVDGATTPSDWYDRNNFSVSAGAGNDSLVDSPTAYGTDTGAGGTVRGNYATYNSAGSAPSVTFTNGNLDASHGAFSSTTGAASTFGVSSGKWYWEVTINAISSGAPYIGIVRSDQLYPFTTLFANNSQGYAYRSTGVKRNNGSDTAYGASYTNGDVIGVALDMDAGTIVFYKNNTSQGTAFSSLSGTFIPIDGNGTSGGTYTSTINFGQRAFAYTAPSGFKALCTQNLPATAIVQGDDYFNVTLYAGNGAGTNTVTTNFGFTPDFIWIKNRTAVADHALQSSPVSWRYLSSNTTGAEGTAQVGSLADNSFLLATANSIWNASSNNYAAWCWKAGGTGVTNTAGTITSTVSANTTSGFSIVTYTGTGANATVGHGLGVAPQMIIHKCRGTAATNWPVYHVGIGNTAVTYLNSTIATSTTSAWLNNTSPTSTVWTIGTDGDINGSTRTYVAYCFAPVAGYSAFGKYTGNGSADGPFVYTGFRPRYVLVKRTDTGGAGFDWFIWDTARSTYNAASANLTANQTVAEGVTAYPLDINSNGFKITNSATAYNASGGTYIYAAFAESPFKYALAR